MTKRELVIIIPAFNEAPVIMQTISSVQLVAKHLPKGYQIVVVDDGSADQTGELAREAGAVVLRHRYNCGLGAALMTGIEYAKRQQFQNLITFDADGQHHPRDLVRAYRRLLAGYDVLIGSRFKSNDNPIPPLRRVVLLVSNIITYLFFGVWTTDSQSGFRALGTRAIQEIRLRSNRMEVSSEFFAEIKKLGLRFAEIPITVSYTDYSLAKGQKNTDSLSVLLKLLYVLGR
jgi:glycosyltransferase involved in cell wall biosynthesis